MRTKKQYEQQLELIAKVNAAGQLLNCEHDVVFALLRDLIDELERRAATTPPAPTPLASLPTIPVHPLRKVLIEHGLIPSTAAARLGVSATVINNAITKWVRPPDAEAIAAKVGIPADALFPPRPAGEPTYRPSHQKHAVTRRKGTNK